MNTDRELLELAAKAAGFDFITQNNADRVYNYWNPLTDDGDALRLAVKLHLLINMIALTKEINVFSKNVYVSVREPEGNDPYAATRRAIVRAAAAIGKEQP